MRTAAAVFLSFLFLIFFWFFSLFSVVVAVNTTSMPRCPSVRLSVYGAITLQTQPADCFIIVPRFNIQAGDSLLLQPISATPLPLSLHCFTAHLLLAGCWLLVVGYLALCSAFCVATLLQWHQQSASQAVKQPFGGCHFTTYNDSCLPIYAPSSFIVITLSGAHAPPPYPGNLVL